MTNATCGATFRLIHRSWGSATDFGHGPCGAPATRVRKVKQAHHDYSSSVYRCEEHARDTDDVIEADSADGASVENAPEAAAVNTACPARARGDLHRIYFGCVECDAYRLSSKTRGQVEYEYQNGHVGQVAFEAFMYVWSTSHERWSSCGWGELPTDHKVLGFAAALRRHAGLPLADNYTGAA